MGDPARPRARGIVGAPLSSPQYLPQRPPPWAARGPGRRRRRAAAANPGDNPGVSPRCAARPGAAGCGHAPHDPCPVLPRGHDGAGPRRPRRHGRPDVGVRPRGAARRLHAAAPPHARGRDRRRPRGDPRGPGARRPPARPAPGRGRPARARGAPPARGGRRARGAVPARVDAGGLRGGAGRRGQRGPRGPRRSGRRGGAVRRCRRVAGPEPQRAGPRGSTLPGRHAVVPDPRT
jgi:hypothetical protein